MTFNRLIKVGEAIERFEDGFSSLINQGKLQADAIETEVALPHKLQNNRPDNAKLLREFR